MWFLAIVAAGTMALGFGAFFFLGRRQRPADVCHARCPRCDQRVRYSLARCGTHILCPRCRRRWTLPGAPSTVPAPTAA